MALVSVIIPCYNHAHFLPHALRSVLAQTYADWESVIVDDGSTDNTHEVALAFQDSRIRYLYQENKGLSAARNVGIRAAQGQFLAFLDADDEWEPDFLIQCLSVLQARKDLIGVYTLNSFIDLSDQYLIKSNGECVSENEFRQRNLEGGFFPVHAALIRTVIVHRIGGFDEQLTSEEDWDFWIKASSQGDLSCVALPLARYRVHPGSMSTHAERMRDNAITVLTKYFGPPEGDPVAWTSEKRRAYGFAFRGAAFRFIQQHQTGKGWQLLQDG